MIKSFTSTPLPSSYPIPSTPYPLPIGNYFVVSVCPSRIYAMQLYILVFPPFLKCKVCI